jgi:hypothetical protein
VGNDPVKHREWYLKNRERLRLKRRTTRSEDYRKIKAWRKSNPAKLRDYALRSKYGITMAQYEEMLDKQNHTCAICKRKETRKSGRSKKVVALSVDHNHRTGKVRKLLCADCNRAIGLMEDNAQRLQSAARYLRNNS